MYPLLPVTKTFMPASLLDLPYLQNPPLDSVDVPQLSAKKRTISMGRENRGQFQAGWV
jgi:hypothetical protein